MSSKRVDAAWLGSDDPWHKWVKRALFASLTVDEILVAEEELGYRMVPPRWADLDATWITVERAAVLVDLPGADAIEMGLALGRRGMRPVLSINASSSRAEVVDMEPVLALLVEGAADASAFPSGPDVAPAFILDARRESEEVAALPGRFDNRWTIFPSDLPSAERLRAASIGAVVVVQSGAVPQADVQAIGWQYQRGGLEVRIADVRERTVVPLPREGRGWLAATVASLRRRLALRRSWDGSYGHRIPLPPQPGHG